ncbi:MAG: phosphoribosyl transferase [Candidatus Melainabacteria bacterium]|nr:phosphoribosyl transferase [Candidatus Melainabacteria bacterium]
MIKYLNTDLIFKDRANAGRQLAEKLIFYKLSNPIVIGLPRGGVVVAKPIADLLNGELDIIVSKKIGALNNPELAVGAVTSHGDYVISPHAEMFHESPLQEIPSLVEDCKERERIYRRDRFQTCSCEGQNVILVDDGTATGMTALAAIKSIKKQNPASLTLAVPVISLDAYDELKSQVNKIETLKIPREFIAVGLHYENFNPVTDDEIKNMLV